MVSIDTESSTYWKEEIKKTELELSNVMLGELSTVKTAKSGEDSTTLQDKKQIVDTLKYYLSYCKQRYQECLDRENTKKPSKSIIYIGRDYGI